MTNCLYEYFTHSFKLIFEVWGKHFNVEIIRCYTLKLPTNFYVLSYNTAFSYLPTPSHIRTQLPTSTNKCPHRNRHIHTSLCFSNYSISSTHIFSPPYFCYHLLTPPHTGTDWFDARRNQPKPNQREKTYVEKNVSNVQNKRTKYTK